MTDAGVAAPSRLAAAGVVTLFAATLFGSAFLLFAVQPMFTKMVLPMLGGSPSVWNTALVFFQATLLAGYTYAHLSTKWLGIRRQTLVHGVVLLGAALSLPIGVAAGWTPPTDGREVVPWLLGLLAVSIGLPFFAVSATAPLLQKWFSHTAHTWSEDPYFLYAASNLGSLLALLAYPVVIEPTLGLGQQSAAWTAGYAVLVAAIGGCALVLWRRFRVPPAGAGAGEGTLVTTITAAVRVRWVLLAMAPSALLLGVTLHITTDIASAPFLWVAPLSLYLLSFVFTFARRPIFKLEWMLAAQVVVMAVTVVIFGVAQIWVVLGVHLLAMFVTAMVCHGMLARLRPVAERLTEFYFWQSLGGVLGGLLVAVIAPQIFNGVYEYPLALFAALALRPMPRQPNSRVYAWISGRTGLAALGTRIATAAPWAVRWNLQRWAMDLALPALLFWLAADNRWAKAFARATTWVVEHGTSTAADIRTVPLDQLGIIVGGAVMALVLMLMGRRPLRFALAVAAVLSALAPDVFGHPAYQLERLRTFFGVYTVNFIRFENSQFNILVNGTTNHGAEYRAEPNMPVTYYALEGPVGAFFSGARMAWDVKRIGVIGLGVGSFACYANRDQQMTYYEIDPAVEAIARDERYFDYLRHCGQNLTVVVGDGRRSLAKEPDGGFDVLILDAFSGDAIPIHLLTKESVALYMQKLGPRGRLLVHITNTYVNLLPVVANIAADAGLYGLSISYTPQNGGDLFDLPSDWVALARDAADLTPLTWGPLLWTPLTPDPSRRLWTDDYSDLFRSLNWTNIGLFQY